MITEAAGTAMLPLKQLGRSSWGLHIPPPPGQWMFSRGMETWIPARWSLQASLKMLWLLLGPWGSQLSSLEFPHWVLPPNVWKREKGKVTKSEEGSSSPCWSPISSWVSSHHHVEENSARLGRTWCSLVRHAGQLETQRWWRSRRGSGWGRQSHYGLGEKSHCLCCGSGVEGVDGGWCWPPALCGSLSSPWLPLSSI